MRVALRILRTLVTHSAGPTAIICVFVFRQFVNVCCAHATQRWLHWYSLWLAQPLGMATQNLIVVSNRLPITIKKDESGEWTSRMSSGGLVAALSGLGEKSFTWVGWVGCEVASEDQESVCKMLKDKHSCVPVYIDEKVADEHYNGFSNGVLWPLCHYLPGDMDYDEKLWNSYEQANKEFVDVVEKIYHPGDLIWIHDYHLMLFAKLFKGRVPNARIGFFLHIPFPSSEIFRALPCRSEILLGVLNCDLIGFHTYDYARHFLKACTRILGLETAPNGVFFKDKFIPVGIFPVGMHHHTVPCKG